MRILIMTTTIGLTISVAAHAETRPNNNVLAGFIAVKELSHCAAFYVKQIDKQPRGTTAREETVWATARLFASAIRIDRTWAEAALPHARAHVSALSDTERQSRYEPICKHIYDSGKYRSRMLGWRYRLNAGEPAPQAFYDLRWEGPMPDEWTGTD